MRSVSAVARARGSQNNDVFIPTTIAPSPKPDADLHARFDLAMEDVYRRAKTEAGYAAIRFFEMLGKHGGLRDARFLLHATNVSQGYTAAVSRMQAP